MKHIISLNGPDNSGKTTQALLIKQNNPNLIEAVGKISQYAPFPRLKGVELYRWWFEDSSPEEFCDVLYTCLGKRNEEIMSKKAPFVVVDKGVANFDARIVATLCHRGLELGEARQLVSNYKDRHSVCSLEDLSLFFYTGDSLVERIRLFESRSSEQGNFSPKENERYLSYQMLQDRMLQTQVDDGVYTILDGTKTSEEVFQDLREAVFFHVASGMDHLPQDKVIFGLSGLSESGKSSVGRYLSMQHNVWNMKINYFLKKTAERYDIPNFSDLTNDDQALVAALMVEQFLEFFESHYYQRSVSIESFHGWELTRRLKGILGDQFNVAYISAPLDLRVERTVASSGIDEEHARARILTKDDGKNSMGIDGVRKDADNIIVNDGSKFDLQRKVDLIVKPRWNFSGNLKMPSSFRIPPDYKDILTEFYYGLLSSFGKDLLFLLFSGSCGREDVHEGWSDIDSVIGLYCNNTKSRISINCLVEGKRLSVGTTVCSYREIGSGFLDAKTTYALYNMQKGLLVPTVCSSELKIPIVDREDVAKRDYTVLPNKLHEVKRMLYSNSGVIDSCKLFKKVVQIMRATLFIDGLDPYGYTDIEESFSRTYGIQRFDFLKVIRGEPNLQDVIAYANIVVDRVCS